MYNLHYGVQETLIYNQCQTVFRFQDAFFTLNSSLALNVSVTRYGILPPPSVFPLPKA